MVPALEGFGLAIQESGPGYTCGPPPARTPGTPWAGSPTRGIVVGPGVFYGDAGNGFVRVALTASDERIDAAVRGLAVAGRQAVTMCDSRHNVARFWGISELPD